jgi:hypothetical protein
MHKAPMPIVRAINIKCIKQSPDCLPTRMAFRRLLDAAVHLEFVIGMLA